MPLLPKRLRQKNAKLAVTTKIVLLKCRLKLRLRRAIQRPSKPAMTLLVKQKLMKQKLMKQKLAKLPKKKPWSLRWKASRRPLRLRKLTKLKKALMTQPTRQSHQQPKRVDVS